MFFIFIYLFYLVLIKHSINKINIFCVSIAHITFIIIIIIIYYCYSFIFYLVSTTIPDFSINLAHTICNVIIWYNY